jgi:hypothetical protein
MVCLKDPFTFAAENAKVALRNLVGNISESAGKASAAICGLVAA